MTARPSPPQPEVAAMQLAIDPSLISLDQAMSAIRSWQAQSDATITRLLAENATLSEALQFAHGAIVDAVMNEDGLDGHAGTRVMEMIRAALIANGQQPPDVPEECAELTPAHYPFWTVAPQIKS